MITETQQHKPFISKWKRIKATPKKIFFLTGTKLWPPASDTLLLAPDNINAAGEGCGASFRQLNPKACRPTGYPSFCSDFTSPYSFIACLPLFCLHPCTSPAWFHSCHSLEVNGVEPGKLDRTHSFQNFVLLGINSRIFSMINPIIYGGHLNAP